MFNLIRAVLRGENQVAANCSIIKNMIFPEMQYFYSILLISMASPEMAPPESDKSEGQFKNSIVGSEKNSTFHNPPLMKNSSCSKVGLGTILSSPLDNIIFGHQVKGSSVQIFLLSDPNNVDETSDSSSSDNPSNYKDDHHKNDSQTEVNVPVPVRIRKSYDWPCVFDSIQSMDSSFTRSSIGLQELTICVKHNRAGFLRLEDIKNSDYYALRINYLPYPKITHMYNYCILEFPSRGSSNNHDGNFNKKMPANIYPPKVHNLRRWSVFSSNVNFLKKCETCDKSLEGIDIYIYRGESSFCSSECRYWKVKAERELAKVTRMVPTAALSPSSKKVVFFVG